MEYVKNNEIVLNVGFEATSALKLGNEFIEFKARFGGTAREIVVPVDHVIAIYARENGQGMAFPVPTAAGCERRKRTPCRRGAARRRAAARARLAPGPHRGGDRQRPRAAAARVPPDEPPEPTSPRPVAQARQVARS